MDPVHAEGAFFQVGIACAATGCAEPIEYATSVRPKSFCKLECHPDTPLQKYW
jgi:hypothetical protein